MASHDRISKFRLQKGLTQEELADLSGVSERTIQRIENGETTPRPYTLRAIAKALDKTYEELIEEKDAAKEEALSVPDIVFLRLFNLSSFSYLIIPWLHFLIPRYLLKKKSGLSEQAQIWGYKIIRQQISWVVAFNLVMLSTLAYNLICAGVLGHRHNHINYFWPFFIMYLINSVMILWNASELRKYSQGVDYQ